MQEINFSPDCPHRIPPVTSRLSPRIQLGRAQVSGGPGRRGTEDCTSALPRAVACTLPSHTPKVANTRIWPGVEGLPRMEASLESGLLWEHSALKCVTLQNSPLPGLPLLLSTKEDGSPPCRLHEKQTEVVHWNLILHVLPVYSMMPEEEV